ncbi:MAG: hypothetical protein JWP25_4700 [Bradyrhizobium sp.]|nr:hypothetical protein [Bradyrhizobium sp.]
MNEVARAEAAASGITPLEYMLGVLRDSSKDSEARMDAAKAAAPYVHARLAAIEHSGGVSLSHEDALSELDDPGEGDPSPSKG